jgi:hypothetical protein
VLAQTQIIVACSLALGIGLFGVVCHLVTREPVFLLFPAGAAVVLLRWFPSEARWAQLSGTAGTAPRHPMIRG